MIFLCLTPFFLAANIYFIYEILEWLDALTFLPIKIIKIAKVILSILCFFCSISIYLAFLMPYDLSAAASPTLYSLRRILKQIGNYHLGVFFYVLMLFTGVFIFRLFESMYIKRKKKANPSYDYPKSSRQIRKAVLGLVNTILILSITIYGVQNAKDIRVKEYDISIDKEAGNIKDLNIVLAADLHLGYNIGCHEMEQMVQKINAQEPDIVIIAGDIFDNEYEALDDPDKLISILSSIKSKYGVYAVYGNHDISERIIGGFTFDTKNPNKQADDRMDDFLNKCNINLLMDEYVLIDDSFYLYGRPDASKPGNGTGTRLSPAELTKDLDMTRPIIVIDHEPRELQELAYAGIDIDLSGHTHDGQFFPLNLTSRYITWENSAGMLKKDNMYSIVTSGVGLFGPNIRIGTHADIIRIQVRFR